MANLFLPSQTGIQSRSIDLVKVVSENLNIFLSTLNVFLH